MSNEEPLLHGAVLRAARKSWKGTGMPPDLCNAGKTHGRHSLPSIQPFDTDSGIDSHLIVLATVRTEWLLEVIPASWPSGWHSPKFSVSGEILLKGDCAVLSCSLQPVSSMVTKPSREGWNAIWEALFSAGSLAHRVGWKSSWG